MRHHIFLSYSREDSEIMRRVQDSLLNANLSVWTDETFEPGTSAWRSAYEDSLQQAGCCIVLLSPASKGAVLIEQQLDKAKVLGLRIFPVIGRGDEWSAIPQAFIGTQIIDVRANHDARMNRLIERIRDHLGITN